MDMSSDSKLTPTGSRLSSSLRSWSPPHEEALPPPVQDEAVKTRELSAVLLQRSATLAGAVLPAGHYDDDGRGRISAVSIQTRRLLCCVRRGQRGTSVAAEHWTMLDL